MRFSVVVFDLDGTLVDSRGDIWACLQHAYAQQGLVLDAAIYDQNWWLLTPLRNIINTATPGLTPLIVEEMVADFRRTYDTSDYLQTTLLPGARELLGELTRQGVRLYVATLKPLLPTRRILDGLKISGFFADVAAPDVQPGVKMDKAQSLAWLIQKWHLDAAQALMVGDYVGDIQAAQTNGLASAAVLSGHGSEADLRAVNPSFVLPGLLDVLGILKGE